MWVSRQFSHSTSIPSSTPLFLCRVSTLCPQTQMLHSSWCTDKKGLKFMGPPSTTNFLRRQFRITNNYFNMSFGESLSLTQTQ